MKSKQFVLAILADLLVTLFDELNDKSQIAFTPEYADGERYSINALVVEIKPFVEAAIGLITSYKKEGKTLMELYGEDNIISIVAQHVESMLNALYSYSHESAEVKNLFKRMICNG